MRLIRIGAASWASFQCEAASPSRSRLNIPALIRCKLTADYSGTPLVKKLGIKSGARVLLVNAPPHFESSLVPIPPDVTFVMDSSSALDVIVLFVTGAEELQRQFVPLSRRLVPSGGLWVAWPKKS